MRKISTLAVVIALLPAYATGNFSFDQLTALELDAKKMAQEFNYLSKNISVAAVSESIVNQNERLLKDSLHDVISLNKTVNVQVNLAIQFWNMYLTSVKTPTMDSYLLGQVMNTLIGTIRALSLRSSLDQAMILNLIKGNSHRGNGYQYDIVRSIDAREINVEDRWNNLKI